MNEDPTRVMPPGDGGRGGRAAAAGAAAAADVTAARVAAEVKGVAAAGGVPIATTAPAG